MIKRSVEPTRQSHDTSSASVAARQAWFDERGADRLELVLSLTYRITTKAGPLDGRASTSNISGGGIQLLIPHAVDPQTPCQITFVLPNHTAPISLAGEVVWSRQVGGARRPQYEVAVGLAKAAGTNPEAFACYCQFVASHLLMKYVR